MYSYDNLTHLPDEILLIILKKLSNIDVLHSLFGVNQQLNRILKDSIFTSHLTLFQRAKIGNFLESKYTIIQLSNSIINRYCSKILPLIREKIQWLDVERISMECILSTTNYPNLNGLGLYNLHKEFVMSLSGK